MNKALYVLIAGLGLMAIPLNTDAAQVRSDRKVEITDVRATADAKEVTIEFRIRPAAKSMGSKYKLYITPYLYAHSDTLWLEPRIILGSNKERREAQQRALAGIKVNPEAKWVLPRKGDSHYRHTVNYRDWMQNASLGICQEVEGCCKVELLADETVAHNFLPKKETPGILLTTPPHIALVAPAPKVAEVNKRWAFSKEELTIDFRVARTEIVPTLLENEQTLTEIVESVNTIRNNPLTRMNKIEITGYASPEGTIRHNAELGRNRSNALKGYLQQAIAPLPDSLFHLNNGVENWKGLRRMVAESKMKYRDEVLRFIDEAPLVDPKTKESKNNRLKKLQGGEPYRYMLKNFYPRLRNACYIAVYYDTLADEAADVINRSVKLIEQREYEKALTSLLTMQGDKRAWNAIGVCYLYLNRLDEGRSWLEKAAQEGDTEAKVNLKLYINN